MKTFKFATVSSQCILTRVVCIFDDNGDDDGAYREEKGPKLSKIGPFSRKKLAKSSSLFPSCPESLERFSPAGGGGENLFSTSTAEFPNLSRRKKKKGRVARGKREKGGGGLNLQNGGFVLQGVCV